jgi:site-specific DNA recombinase
VAPNHAAELAPFCAAVDTHHFNDLVTTSAGLTITQLATKAGVSPSYFTRVFRLGFLAPEITKAIVQGRQPHEFSAIKLMTAGRLACAWSDQRRQLGFD